MIVTLLCYRFSDTSSVVFDDDSEDNDEPDEEDWVWEEGPSFDNQGDEADVSSVSGPGQSSGPRRASTPVRMQPTSSYSHLQSTSLLTQ